MQFGLSIPTLTGFPRDSEPADGGWRTRWNRTFEICDMAEDLGYAIGTVGHHRFTTDRIDSSQPFIALAAIAARTSKLRLTSNIAVIGLHDPIDLAEQIAMVDEISDGRIMLGAAIGYRPYEFELIGLDYKKRVSRFAEAIDVIRMAWRDAPVHYEGQHFKVMGANVTPKPVQKPGPAILIGAQVEPAILRAAQLGDGWLTDNMDDAEAIGEKGRMFRAASKAAGNAGTIVLNRKVGIADDRDWLEDVWLPPIIDVYRNYLELGVPFADDFASKLRSGTKLRIDDLPPGQIIAGTPDEVAAAMQYCIDKTECDSIIVDFGRGSHGDEYDRARMMAELFGRTVLPRFAAS